MVSFNKLIAAGALTASALAAGPASALPVTFANFSQIGAKTPFTFTTTAISGTLSAVDVPVFFQFAAPSLLGTALAPILSVALPAHLTLTAIADTAAGSAGVFAGTSTVFESFSSLKFSFTLDQPFRAKTNLLTGVITKTADGEAMEFGTRGTAVASLAGGTGDAADPSATVTYTSDFLNFSGTVERDASLSFSGLTPSLSVSRGARFIHAFAADGTGTFDSDPPPIVTPAGSAPSVPEPGPTGALVAGLFALGAMHRRAPRHQVG